MRIALASILVVLAGCHPGFYRIKTAPLSPPAGSPAATAAPQAAEVKPAAGAPAAESLPQPYVTLTVTGNLDGITSGKVNLVRDLQILTLNADFTDGDAKPVRVPILAYDLKNGSELIPKSFDILKAYPFRRDASGNFSLRLSSSAVEENLADQFKKVLSIVTAAVPAGTLSPAVTQAITSATTVLESFQTSNSAASSIQPITINSAVDAEGTLLSDTATIIFLVPTHGTADDYKKRVESIERSALKLCGSKLCVTREGGDTAFDGFAYVILKPTLTYRISRPSFPWTYLQPNGACPYTQDDYDAYVGDIVQQRSYLTASQYGMERELARTFRHYLEVSAFVTKADYAGAFSALDEEWAGGTPASWLYARSFGTQSYQATQAAFRDCMTRAGDAKLPGLFTSYVAAMKWIRSGDETANASRIEQGLSVLQDLGGLLTSYKITDARVSAVLGANIASTERSLFKVQFAPEVALLVDPAHKNAACSRLEQLAQTSICTTCVQKARVSLTERCGKDRKVIASAAASKRATQLEGALFVLKSASESLAKLGPNGGGQSDLTAETEKIAAALSRARSGSAGDLDAAGRSIEILRATIVPGVEAIAHDPRVGGTKG